MYTNPVKQESQMSCPGQRICDMSEDIVFKDLVQRR